MSNPEINPEAFKKEVIEGGIYGNSGEGKEDTSSIVELSPEEEALLKEAEWGSKTVAVEDIRKDGDMGSPAF